MQLKGHIQFIDNIQVCPRADRTHCFLNKLKGNFVIKHHRIHAQATIVSGRKNATQERVQHLFLSSPGGKR